MSRFPVGQKTIDKAAKTEAGKLAASLNRVMYSADNAEIRMFSHRGTDGVAEYTIKAHKYVCQDVVFRNQDALPKGVRATGHGGSYFETEQLMIAIRDYLEAAAIREVCE